MHSLVNLGNILLLIILLLIFYAHLQGFGNHSNKFIKVMIILSFLIFVVIFVEHIIYVSKNEKKNTEQYMKYIDYSVNPNNMAIRLWTQLLAHPIFHIY